MRQHGVTRVIFSAEERTRRAHTRAEIIFFTDTTPWQLMMALVSEHGRFAITFPVTNYRIPTYLEGRLKELRGVLGLVGTGRGEFTTSDFFANLLAQHPTDLLDSHEPRASQVYRVSRPDVDEADKIHFVGWRDNKKRGEYVSAKNLSKTGLLLGPEARKLCANTNVSSCWSDIPPRLGERAAGEAVQRLRDGEMFDDE